MLSGTSFEPSRAWTVRVDEVPDHIRSVMQSRDYAIEYLVWVARSGSAFVPTSYEDLEFSVTAATDPVAYDDHGPIVDYSPRALPERTYKPLGTGRDPRPFIA
ncbi:hypothetical protein BN159_8237 [Streptomyces davaonensis JCM 4913]|uniref:Uncharacterized protein n=2 Tax=Streptomyces davaonensis TaxID=348043 RepID=K4RG22_STRDJ|nr:hypothetical protein BN159_8237 [Streptomyces davaonensis JCM 4913]